MGQDQATPQSKMDDLLATLRKGLGSGANIGGGLGATSSANLPAEPNGSAPIPAPKQVSPSDEISTIRKRIAGKIGRDFQPNGFAAILSGRPLASAPPEPALIEDRGQDHVIPPPNDPPPDLRQSVSDDDAADVAQISVRAPKPETEQLRARSRPARPLAAWQTADRYEQAETRHQELMLETASVAANAAFNRLAETLMTRTLGDRPIEELSREMLRTLLKQWLDDNLPGLVERIVRDEIERVARRGARR